MSGWISPGGEHSEKDLERRVLSFLASSGFSSLRRLSVEVSGDRVLLKGSVGSYYAKQLAQEYARRVAGVRRVINLVQVGVILDSDEPYDPPTEILLTIPVSRKAV